MDVRIARCPAFLQWRDRLKVAQILATYLDIASSHADLLDAARGVRMERTYENSNPRAVCYRPFRSILRTSCHSAGGGGGRENRSGAIKARASSDHGSSN